MPFGFGKKKVMNFFKQHLTSAISEVSSNFREKDKSNRDPFFNQFAEQAGRLVLCCKKS